MKVLLALALALPASAGNRAAPGRPFGTAPAAVAAAAAAPFQSVTGVRLSGLSENALASFNAGLAAEGVGAAALAKMPEAQAREAVERAVQRARVSVVAYAEALARAAEEPEVPGRDRKAASAELQRALGDYGPLLTEKGRSRVAILAADARRAQTMLVFEQIARALEQDKKAAPAEAIGRELARTNGYALGWSRVSSLRGIARGSQDPVARLAAVKALAEEARRVSEPTYAAHVVEMLADAAAAVPNASAKELALSALALERTAKLGKEYAALVRASEAKVLASFEAPAEKGPPPGPPSMRKRQSALAKRANAGMAAFGAIVLAHWAEHVIQMAQVYLLDWPRAQAGGVLGLYFPWLVKSELLHYGYALAMLIGLWKLRGMFRGNAAKWWGLALGLQMWHHFEHFLLISQATMGMLPPTSIIQLLAPRIELHMFYNSIVTIPMLVALWQQRALMKMKTPGKWPQILGWATMIGTAAFLIWAALYTTGGSAAMHSHH